MTAPQFILSPLGEELVVLARADYDSLVSAAGLLDDEDADDVAIYDARLADMEGSQPLPPAVSAEVLKGSSLLKALRTWRGLSQVQLAQAAAIGQGFLSDLERNAKRPGAETAEALAAALDVPVAWIR